MLPLRVSAWVNTLFLPAGWARHKKGMEKLSRIRKNGFLFMCSSFLKSTKSSCALAGA
jgi:hypothetical protein